MTKKWLKWSSQLRTVKVPRSIIRGVGKIKAVHLHVFADARKVILHALQKRLLSWKKILSCKRPILTFKSRISKQNTTIARLELVSGGIWQPTWSRICGEH